MATWSMYYEFTPIATSVTTKRGCAPWVLFTIDHRRPSSSSTSTCHFSFQPHHVETTATNVKMRRLLRPRISPLEAFIHRASQPVPSNLRPYYLSPHPNNDAATALLNTLSPTDVLQLRLVSKSIHDWTDARLDELFRTLYYTITIINQESGTLVRTPTAVRPLRTIGQLCTHFVITILSPTSAFIPNSTPAPSPNLTSTSTSKSKSKSKSKSRSRSTLPKPDSYPELLTHFLKYLFTQYIPSLHTLTLSVPGPRPWRPEATTHSTLIHIRQALESLPPTTKLRLNLNPISLIHLVSLKWRGSTYGEEVGWTGTRFWLGLRVLDLAIFVPLEVYGGGRRRGLGARTGEDENGDREVRDERVRTGMKTLHDWLGGFGRGLQLLGFEWLALPEEEFDAVVDTVTSDHPGSGPPPALQITGPNPLTLYLNPTSFTFTSSPPLSLYATAFPPSVQQHQYQTRHPAPLTSMSIPTSPGMANHPSGPYRLKRISTPPIQWENLGEVWLRGVEVETLATWWAGVRSLENLYVWEDLVPGDEDYEEAQEEGGRWVRYGGVGWGGQEEEEDGQEGGDDGPLREEVSVGVRGVLES